MGVAKATATTYTPPARLEENAVLEQLWSSLGVGMPWAAFLAELRDRATDYVLDCRRRRQDPRYERGYAPSKFAEWVNGADDDVDGAMQSHHGDPTEDELARGGT